jgi:hypothetical protein
MSARDKPMDEGLRCAFVEDLLILKDHLIREAYGLGHRTAGTLAWLLCFPVISQCAQSGPSSAIARRS